MRKQTDRRYHTTRWRRLALSIVRRDQWRCYAEGCGVPAKVADHIHPVHAYTSDAEFFDAHGLRAACQGHNLARGFGVDPAGEARFFSPMTSARLRRPNLPPHERRLAEVRDYTRQKDDDGRSAR